jgi:hypothetical protein
MLGGQEERRIRVATKVRRIRVATKVRRIRVATKVRRIRVATKVRRIRLATKVVDEALRQDGETMLASSPIFNVFRQNLNFYLET